MNVLFPSLYSRETWAKSQGIIEVDAQILAESAKSDDFSEVHL